MGKAEHASAKTKKKKWEQLIMQEYTRKKTVRSEKLHPSIKRS